MHILRRTLSYVISRVILSNFQILVPPSIYLDHSLKDRAIVVRAGHKLKLDIPISGEPAPTPEWKKGPKVS